MAKVVSQCLREYKEVSQALFMHLRWVAAHGYSYITNVISLVYEVLCVLYTCIHWFQ